jgi:uncharacterized protein (TIGR02246 family)
LIVFITVTSLASIFAQEINEDSTITKVIDLYEQALNTQSVEGVLDLFSEDGVLVLQGSPTHIGIEAIEKFYVSIFKVIDFNLKFYIEEIILMSPAWATVRTITRQNNSNSLSEGGHEIFILKKQTDGNWKIARYAGSSAN